MPAVSNHQIVSGQLRLSAHPSDLTITNTEDQMIKAKPCAAPQPHRKLNQAPFNDLFQGLTLIDFGVRCRAKSYFL